jgi:hypothetical protein
VTDGYYNSTCTFFLGGVWAIYANATDAIGGAPVLNMAWALPTYPVNNTWNYTHVYIQAGGFFWRPQAGWNLISVPKNISAVLLPFTAEQAGNLTNDAAVGAGIVLTEIVVAQAQFGSNPIAYDTYTWGVGGTNFVLGIDYAYWLYVDADMSAEGVFVQCEEVTPGDQGELELGVGEIDAAGLNNVVLPAYAWTMVSTSAGWANNSIYSGHVGGHTDTRGNTGAWSLGTTDFYTGGGYIPGIGGNKAFYSQPGIPANVYMGQDDNAGIWISQAVVIDDSASWTPGLPWGVFEGRAYSAGFYGQQDFGEGSANDATPLYYASGFWVFSIAGGNFDYDINYDYTALPPESAPAPYLP